MNTAESANEADSALHHHSAVAVNQYFCDRRIEGNLRSSNPESMAPSISPYITASGAIEGNGSRRGRPLCLPGNKHNYLVLARSPDLARVLTIRSPSVLSVVLAVVLPDLASTGESREFRYILKIA